MRVLKFIHTADLHLGSVFGNTPEIAGKRKAEQLDTLREIVSLCAARESDLLLICGDLFDCVRVEESLLREVQSILGKCSAKVFITPGNHDPAVPDSCYRQEGWPENVRIFLGGIESISLEDKGAVIWGCAFKRSIETASLLTPFTPDPSAINILMMHADLVPKSAVNDTGTGSRYNPVTEEMIYDLDIDYAALGHAHKAFTGQKGDFTYCNPGCPSGRGFDETGDKGVYAGMAGRRFSHIEFIPLNGRRYYSDKTDLSGCVVTDDFRKAILEFLKNNYGEHFKDNIYDITIGGALPKGVMPDISSISKLLMEDVHYVRLTDRTTTELDIAALMKDTTLRGAFVRTVASKIEKDSGNRDKYLRALLYGLRAFDEEIKFQ